MCGYKRVAPGILAVMGLILVLTVVVEVAHGINLQGTENTQK